jgi:hypothetical protein
VPTNYILLDLENVQPKNLNMLLDHPFKIYVFVGENQTKIPFDLVATMQSFGENGKYIKIPGNGNNALDFHIAYYLGNLTTVDSDGYYYIISKDTGFDPLIKHLKKNKIKIFRHKDLAEISLLRISSAKNIEETIEAVIKNLLGRGQSRPRKLSTLSNTINSLLSEKLNKKEMSSFINELKNKGYITVEQDKVLYNLQK